MKEKFEVHRLRLHESAVMVRMGKPVIVLRVPGGWLYKVGTAAPVFVPYSNEFLQSVS